MEPISRREEAGETSPLLDQSRTPQVKSRVCQLKPWLLIGAGVLLAAGGTVMILMGRNVIPVDLNSFRSLLMLGFGVGISGIGVGLIGGTAIYTIRKISQSPKFLELRVVSFNVGSSRDWENLAIREDLKREEGWDISSTVSREEMERRTGPRRIAKEALNTRENQKIDRHLGALLNNFDPDVIFLQEYFGNIRHGDEYYHLRDILTQRGYTISMGKDCCIAYKTAVFSGAANAAISDPFVTNARGDRQAVQDLPTVIALTHTATQKRIKLASHHVPGFHGAEQKQATAQRKAQGGAKKDAAKMIRDRQFRNQVLNSESNNRTREGDVAVSVALAGIEEPQDDLVIHGLDANTTSKSSSADPKRRLHPVRMNMFLWDGYSLDNTNQAPTIIDANGFQKRKYDYVAAKAPKTAHVAVRDQIVQGVNTPDLLDQPDQIMSDHLPVLSIVTALV